MASKVSQAHALVGRKRIVVPSTMSLIFLLAACFFGTLQAVVDGASARNAGLVKELGWDATGREVNIFYRDGREVAREIIDLPAWTEGSHPPVKVEGTIPDGVYRVYKKELGIREEKLVKEETYKDGQLNGITKEYDEAGRVHAERNYKGGVLDGLSKIYAVEGWLLFEETYSMGQLVGMTQYKQDGTIYSQHTDDLSTGDRVEKTYYGSGQPWIEQTFNDEALVSKTYYPDGALKSEGVRYLKPDQPAYMQPRPEGVLKTYYETGELKSEEQTKGSMADGLTRRYYKSGQLRHEGNYTNGERTGLHKSYYESGKLESETEYRDNFWVVSRTTYYESGKVKSVFKTTPGTKDGVEEEFDENGNRKRRRTFKDGKEFKRAN